MKKEITKTESSNVIKVGKRELEKLNNTEQKERNKFRWEVYWKLWLLTNEQKEFFLNIIDYANNNNWDFDIDSTVEKKRPNNYWDIMYLFRCLTKVWRLDNNKIDKILRKRNSDGLLSKTKEELKKALD